MEPTPVLSIVGPTASGKTALSVALAKRYGAEIVSADSMQIYQGMDIATAKPTPEERGGIKHHLLDFLPPQAPYSVAAFVKDAQQAIADIRARGRQVIVVGGTGLYVDALLFSMAFPEQEDAGRIRAQLEARLASQGASALYCALEEIDPVYAATVHPNNTKRVLRALEIYYATGKTPTVYRALAKETQSPYRVMTVGITFRDRQLLYDRIDRRVNAMLDAGLVAEAERYHALPAQATAAQAIGYKELAPYFEGKIPLDEAAQNLKRATRRYAKRQLTWFKKTPEICWIERDGMSDEALAAAAAAEIERVGIFREKGSYGETQHKTE